MKKNQKKMKKLSQKIIMKKKYYIPLKKDKKDLKK